jgi:hypothetical protein
MKGKEREMKRIVILLTVMLPFMVNFVSASAEQYQMPKEGRTNYVIYYTGRLLASMNMGDVGSQALVELVGVSRNTDGQKYFDNMAVRCLVYRETVAGKLRAYGSCTETDIDGDKVFATFDSAVMIHTIIGGTGKYKGISGSEPYTWKGLPEAGEGLTTSIADLKVTWQFK